MGLNYIQCNNILDLPLNIEVRQVYIWAESTDNKFILVSKNGIKYQQPGGHPEENESINQTMIRELKEEAGLELTMQDLTNIKFIGYYKIEEENECYLQLRFHLQLNKTSTEYNLEPLERESEKEEDRINYAKFFTIEEAYTVISWLKGSNEVMSLI